jgi:tetratricopeptide (TPR) repeat protein
VADARFCVQCGAKLVAEANFCVECGTKVPGAKRAPGTRFTLGRYAPIVVVGSVLLIAGGAVSIGLLNPKAPPSVPPHEPAVAAAGAPATAGGAAPGGAPQNVGGTMPEGHPPVQIPDDVKQTIRDMAKAAEAQPDNVAMWKQLAEVQYRAGQVDASYLPEAQLSFQHVLDKEPDNIDALRDLGNIAFDREQPEKAIEYYRRYLTVKPDDQMVQTDLATMQLAAGKIDEAIANYQKILTADPKFFQAQFNLGLAYHRAGRSGEAVAALQKARELASDERARKQVEQVLARMSGAGGAPAAGSGAEAADTLRAGIEKFFRTHQIIAAKLDRFDWDGDRSVRVMLHDFPMTAMPEFVRKQLGDRIRGQIKEQKTAHQVSEPVQVLLVDSATGETMETISE